jgi:GH24 family phage-related lysozyme (muramidase)
MGDTTTPVQALQRTLAHIQQDESGIKRCVTAPLTQAEYDTMVDFSYQYGPAALCKSTVVKLVNQGDYAGSCQAYAKFRYVAGRDCAIRSNGCYGVWTRQQARIAKCMGEQ